MNRILFVCALVSSALAFGELSRARAASIAEDSFDGYPPGALPGNSGGSGWAGPWQMGAGNTATVVDTSAAPLVFEPEGATPIEGGARAVELRGTGNQITATRPLAAPLTETFYISCLVRVSAGAWTDTDTFGVHLGADTTSTATLNFGTRGMDGGGGVFMVRTGTGAPVADAFANGSVEVGDVNYLVARVSKQDIDGNTTATFDRAEVWLNPAVDAVTAAPAGDYRVQLGAGAGVTAVSHILLRIAALEAADAIQVDQLRISADWPVGVSPLPRIQDLTPAGQSSFVDPAQGIRFTATSAEALPLSSIGLRLNGKDVSGDLQITGDANARNAAYLGLHPNALYSAEISVTNSFGVTTRTIQFDTFSESSFLVEAEDFNFDGGQFYDDPVLCNDPGGSSENCYFDRVGVQGIDANETAGAADNTAAANYLEIYRWGSDFIERAENVDTFTTQDTSRRKFAEAPPGAQGPIKDFDITQIAAGDWLNYTRTYPTGTFAIYLRARSTAPQQVALSRVTNPSASSQTATVLGSFNVPNTGGAYVFVPLSTASGAELPLPLSGRDTLRLTANEANNNIQWNYFLLAPGEAVIAPAFIASTTPSDGAMNVLPDALVRVEIANGATTVQGSSVVLMVDGENVGSRTTVSTTSAGVSVSYAPGFLLPGAHTLSIRFQDSGGALVEKTWTFSVVNLPVLPAGWAAPAGSGADRGFSVRSVQILDPDLAASLPRNLARVEDQLAGVIQADFAGTDMPQVINYKERGDIGDQGYFTAANGFPDNVAQDLGLVSFESHDHFAVETIFYLDLMPGLAQIGANVNDTFRLRAGPGGSGADAFPLIIGEWPGEGAATAAQPQYSANFLVTQAGVYAFRFIWAEYVGSSSAEIHIKDADGDSHLLNDDTPVNGKPSPLRAYRRRTQEPPREIRLSIAPQVDGSVRIDWSGAGRLQSAPAVTGQWDFVADSSNPYITTPQGTVFFRVAQ